MNKKKGINRPRVKNKKIIFFQKKSVKKKNGKTNIKIMNLACKL